MNEEEKNRSAEVEGTSVVTVNEDPKAGPLDGASATVAVVKTRFNDNGSMKQRRLTGSLKASYELGVVSISVPGEKLMLIVRIDDVMQTMFASAAAYKKLHPKKENKEEDNKHDREG